MTHLHSWHLHAGLVMTELQWMMILVSYLQVELVILGLGLAFGALYGYQQSWQGLQAVLLTSDFLNRSQFSEICDPRIF